MKKELSLNLSKTAPYIAAEEMKLMESQVHMAHDLLHKGGGAGSDFLGWVELPIKYDVTEFKAIQQAAKQIQDTSEALVVIGIGGSYLGARAAIEMLNHSFYNQLRGGERPSPQIYYLGQTISPTYTAELLEVLAEKDFSVNIISKSGTTTEPAIAFRLIKELLIKKYGADGAKRRIYATTDRDKGALKKLADNEGYTQFVIPDDVGGRYSVLTPVGLLPIAASGINIQEIMDGAKASYKTYLKPDLEANAAYQYAIVRNILYRKGKLIEILINYEPNLHYFSEWWKQLFGESEGKNQKGIFPAACASQSKRKAIRPAQKIKLGP